MIGHDNTVAMSVDEAAYIQALVMIDIAQHPTVPVDLPTVTSLLDRLAFRISQGD